MYFYGRTICCSINDVYQKFCEDYNKELGRQVSSLGLDRVGRRKERIHGFGFVFVGGNSFGDRFMKYKRTNCYIEGLMQISYVRMIGIWDYPPISSNDFEDWLDWIFSRGNKWLRTVGTKQKVGRTSKILKKRYR